MMNDMDWKTLTLSWELKGAERSRRIYRNYRAIKFAIFRSEFSRNLISPLDTDLFLHSICRL
jgi:hypothetical protein